MKENENNEGIRSETIGNTGALKEIYWLDNFRWFNYASEKCSIIYLSFFVFLLAAVVISLLNARTLAIFFILMLILFYIKISIDTLKMCPKRVGFTEDSIYLDTYIGGLRCFSWDPIEHIEQFKAFGKFKNNAFDLKINQLESTDIKNQKKELNEWFTIKPMVGRLILMLKTEIIENKDIHKYLPIDTTILPEKWTKKTIEERKQIIEYKLKFIKLTIKFCVVFLLASVFIILSSFFRKNYIMDLTFGIAGLLIFFTIFFFKTINQNLTNELDTLMDESVYEMPIIGELVENNIE